MIQCKYDRYKILENFQLYIYLLQYYLLAVIIIINHYLVESLLLKKPNETVVEQNKTQVVNYIIAIYTDMYSTYTVNG